MLNITRTQGKLNRLSNEVKRDMIFLKSSTYSEFFNLSSEIAFHIVAAAYENRPAPYFFVLIFGTSIYPASIWNSE